MAISLDSLASPEVGPIIGTLVGEGGVGKTSLAALFPSPVFIRAEDGLSSLVGQDVKAFPLAKQSQDIFDAIQVLATQEHSFKTAIIDSVTQLNTMFEHEVVASDPKSNSINTALGGYGAGHSAVSERHRQIREWCDALMETKGMNVIFIAHADSETVELPDQDPYTRYSIRINKRSIAHYSDNVDLVGFIKLRTFTRGEGDKKKAIGDGSRIVTCYPTPSHISKNRFKIKEDLVFEEGVNPMVPFIPALQQQLGE